MPEKTPELNRETQHSHGPEAGAEFYQEAQIRRSSTDFERDELSDKIKSGILESAPKPEPTDSSPADDSVLNEEERKNPLEWIRKTISNKNLDPNQAMRGLIEAHDQEQDNPNKAA